MAASEAPPRKLSPAEEAALQKAGQYAGTSDVLTPESAPSYGLDPGKGYIAPKFGVSEPPQGTWNPAPILKQILETQVPFIPPLWQSTRPEHYDPSHPGWNPDPIAGQILHTQIPGTPGQAPPPAPEQKADEQPKPEAKTPAYPGAIPDKQPDAKKASGYPGAIPDEQPKPEAKQVSAYPGAIPDEQPKQPQVAQPPQGPQAQQVQPEEGQPPASRHIELGERLPAIVTPPAEKKQPVATQGEQDKKPEVAPAGDVIEPTKIYHTPAGDVTTPDYIVPGTGGKKASDYPSTVSGGGQEEPPVKRTQQEPVEPLKSPTPLDQKTTRTWRATWFGRNPDGSVDTTDEKTMSYYNAHHGAWGADLLDKNLVGVAVSPQFLRANGVDVKTSPGSQGYKMRVTAPNGQTRVVDIVDLGPQNTIDMTYGLGKALGLNDNSQLSFQLLDHQDKAVTLGDEGRGGGGGGKKGTTTTAGAPGGPLAGQPMFSIPSAPRRPEAVAEPSQPPSGGGGGGVSYGGQGGVSQDMGGGVNLTSAAALAMMMRGVGGQRTGAAAAPPTEEEQPSALVAALVNRGFTQQQAEAYALGKQTILPYTAPRQPPAAPGVQGPAALALGPPTAPGGVAGSQAGLADAIKALQALGIKKGQAQAMLQGAKGKTVQELVRSALQARQQAKGGALPKTRPVQAKVVLPPPAPTPKAPVPEPEGEERLPRGYSWQQDQEGRTWTVGPGGEKSIGKQIPFGDYEKETKEKYPSAKEPTPYPTTSGAGMPPTPQERRAQIAAHTEQAIAEKRPMHISYISAPKEAARHPTRESRTIQYEEHSPEARLMGTTTGQLVGHSLIPVESKVTKEGEPYVLGLSTNVMANNHRHINEKLAAMGRKSPYPEFDHNFFNGVEGYLANLNAGHTGTGQGYQVGTEEHQIDPDLSHLPHKLTRNQADFINLVINNTKAFAKANQPLRELARANGTLITEAGETNRMRHNIEQHEPGWRQRVLEPSVRSFKSGLIHEVHPTEESLPETIRPGPEYQDLTKTLHRAIQRGRPDIPISVSLHHNFEHNKLINRIERDFSDGKIHETDARAKLESLGEDPDEYRFIPGSGGLITPYEESPEAITPEEHSQLKDNLRKQWIGGKMPVEDYRRKVAEVPLPEIASRKSTTTSEGTEATAPAPKPPKLVKPPPAEPSEEEQTPSPEPIAPQPIAPSPAKQPKLPTAATEPGEPVSEPKAKRPPAPNEPLPLVTKPAKAPEAATPAKPRPPAPDEPLPPIKKEAKEPEPEAAEVAEPLLPATKAKKAKKSPEQIAAEKEDLRQADIHRKNVTPEQQAARDEVQRKAQAALDEKPESDPLSAHHYINGHAVLPDWIETKEHIGKHFDEVNPKLDYAKDEHRQRAADALTHDVLHGLSKNSSAYDWYDDTVDKSLNHIGQVAPKILTHKDHEMAFKLATAITSQGQDVFPNFDSGYLAYRHWHKTGKLPEDPAIFGGGTKAQAMVANFKKVNRLWKELGHDGLREVLEKKMTMRKLRDDYGVDIGGESPDHEMEGAAMLGPKIGSFYNNLNKRFHSTTFDLWATRNLNRIAGKMLKFSPNSLFKDSVGKKGPRPGQLSRLDALLANGKIEGADPAQLRTMSAQAAALRKLKNPTREGVLRVAPTIAEWASREHNRYAKGTGGRSYPKELKNDSTSLAKNMDLNLTDLADAPRGPKQRQQFRDIYQRTQDNLAKHGIDMAHASNQAVLWFIEQKLFQMGGSRNRPSFDYLDASHRLVRKIKSGELPGLHEEPMRQAA